MLDPESRPELKLLAMVELLAEHGVKWVLAGSTVLAVYGLDGPPNDLDVVPAPDEDNLARLGAALEALEAIPAFSPGWREEFTLETCRSWKPKPSTRANLEYLYVTRLGMLDLPFELCGSYASLTPDAVPVEMGGVMVSVSAPMTVLEGMARRGRPKDLMRLESWSRTFPELASPLEPAGLSRLLADPV